MGCGVEEVAEVEREEEEEEEEEERQALPIRYCTYLSEPLF